MCPVTMLYKKMCGKKLPLFELPLNKNVGFDWGKKRKTDDLSRFLSVQISTGIDSSVQSSCIEPGDFLRAASVFFQGRRGEKK